MKGRAWILVVVTLVLLVVIFGAVLAVGLIAFSGAGVAVRDDTVLEIALAGPLYELPHSNPLAEFFLGEGLTLWEYGEALRYAAQDERVTGVLLQIQPLMMSWGQLEELRDYVKEFRKSGKQVHAFLAVDMVGEGELYLASAADTITVNPDAGLLVNGLLAEVTFYKHTMDKLRIQPNFIQFKEYKSAEPYTRDRMTPEIREMLESILFDIQNRFVSTLAGERGVEPGRIQAVMETGMGSVSLALEEKLVDALGYRDQLETRLKGEAEDFRSLKASRYLKAVRDDFRKTSRNRVAVVGGLGTITSGNSDPFSEIMGGNTVATHLRELRENERIKGVIFRVDSPGGSAVGSDMVWREVRQLEEAGKPVIISMSGVAGSGGYYVSMGARHIVSQPSTITGSIGVIFGKFDIEGLYEWLGMTVDQVKVSPNADILSFFESLTEEQKRGVEQWMETIYRTFVEKAAEGRGLQFDELEAHARGRIYTGAQAVELGLVDELGGLQTAVRQMRQALELSADEEIQLVLYPRKKTVWEAFASGDFIKLWQRGSLEQWLRAELPRLGNPGVWMITPQIRIY